MAFISFTPGSVIKSTDMNANFVLAVGTDVSKTIVVTHTFTPSQTFTGGWTAAAACTISAGGIAVTGASSVTGALNVTTTLTAGAGDFGPAAGQIARFQGSGAAGGYLRVRDATNVADRGFIGYGTSVFVGAAITDFGITSEGGDLVFAITGGNIKARIAAATGIFSAPFGITGNVIGNLTGTVLTASQPNITSVGALTSLNVVSSSGNTVAVSTTVNLPTFASVTIDSAGTPKTVILGADQTVGGFVGTLTNQSFGIRTNNVVRLTIDTAGAAVFTAGVTATLFSGPLTGNVTGNLTGTVLTASQTNITAVGTLTSLTVSGTSNTTGISNTGINGIDNTTTYKVGGVIVVTSRKTGWSTQSTALARADMGAAPTLATTYSTLAALITDLLAHGLIGT